MIQDAGDGHQGLTGRHHAAVLRGVYESYQQDPRCQAVEQAWNAGIVVVVAAGNDGRDNSAGTSGYGTITAPGNDPYPNHQAGPGCSRQSRAL
jgi:hypothetical protein